MEKTATILIIDDDSAVCRWISDVLDGAGYSLRLASDGSAALPELRAANIDLLITDIVMPGQEGIETIRGIRREFPELKIVAMSGASVSYLKMATMFGANASLLKPFSSDELLLTVRQLLG